MKDSLQWYLLTIISWMCISCVLLVDPHVNLFGFLLKRSIYPLEILNWALLFEDMALPVQVSEALITFNYLWDDILSLYVGQFNLTAFHMHFYGLSILISSMQISLRMCQLIHGKLRLQIRPLTICRSWDNCYCDSLNLIIEIWFLLCHATHLLIKS